MVRLETFPDRDAVAGAAASVLAAALHGEGKRSFIATGGTTPGPTYDRLAKAPLDWAQITIAPTDERFVDPSRPDSNAHLLRTRLLVGHAAAASFVPLKRHGARPQDDAKAAEPEIAGLLPSAAMLLGMGPDGHVGSLFPGAHDLAAHLDLDGERLVVGVPVSPDKPKEPRISLTLAAMVKTGLIVILITGEEKRGVVERALGGDASLPVGAVLSQSRAPVRILWAP
ncbi:MAG: 6-phosphogluconolactonase [Caulobacteraceae bacterium]